MLVVFILLLTSLLMLLTLKQIITVNLIINEDFCLSLDFLFMRFFLYPFKNSRSPFQKSKQKRDKKINLSKKFSKGRERLGLFSEILKRSEVDIIEATFPKPNAPPAEYVIKSEGFYALISTIIFAIKSKAKSCKCRVDDFFSDENDRVLLNVSLKASLFDVLISLFTYKFRKRKFV